MQKHNISSLQAALKMADKEDALGVVCLLAALYEMND